MPDCNRECLSIQERMLSAVTGSVLTSFTLTPMDVVRIRLQQQELIQPCKCERAIGAYEGIRNGSNVSTLVGSKVTNLRNFSSSSSSVQPDGLAALKVPCLEEVSCLRKAVKFGGTWEAFWKIAKLEGPMTLWRGLTLNLVMAIPSNIVYFTGYEYIRDNSPLAKTSPTLNSLTCGALARICAATSVAPFEVTKTKLQSIPKASKNTKTRTLVRGLYEETKVEFRTDGALRTLFRGLGITLWRDVPFSAIYWTTYEFSKRNLWIENSKHRKNSIHFINSFLSGCLAGTIAAVATHPFDVAKTRCQISILTKVETSKYKPSTSSTGMFKLLGSMYKNEGFRALYAGLTARVLKIAPSCAIMISTYEISKKFFTNAPI